jgi:hypothetical protein
MDKRKKSDELIIANKELAFQNEEKEKRAAELIIANKELVFQNEEKEKRGDLNKKTRQACLKPTLQSPDTGYSLLQLLFCSSLFKSVHRPC